MNNNIISILYNPNNDHYYLKIDSDDLTQADSRQYCEAFGGHLATLTSQLENDFVYYNFANDGKAYSLGGTDQIQEGKWKWITGEMWSYTNWSVNQPDDAYSGEDYLYFYRRDSNAWNDAGLPTGDLKRSFICEWDNMGDLVDILKKTDIDGDNDVDGFDLLLFSNAFGTNLSSLNYDPLLDFEEDGDVDQFDLAVITYMFGQTEVPLIIANVPALDQSDYTDADQNTYLESVSSIAAGECVSASFTSMFLGHFNEFGLQNYIDTSTDTSSIRVNVISSIRLKVSEVSVDVSM